MHQGAADFDLEQSVYHTLRYFDIHDMPVTATQIWRCLLAPPRTDRQEKSSALPAVIYSLAQVRTALQQSIFLKERLGTQWGYFFLRNRAGIVERRLQRHRAAQMKWKITRRVLRFLQYVPYVRLLAGSGSLALFNTKETSDLDVFVVTRPGRIWTTRLLLLVVTQLLGRRRTHWERQAPNKVCLNHYVTETSLVIPAPIRNAYTAVLYAHLIPEFGLSTYQQFMTANSDWMGSFMVRPSVPLLATARPLQPSAVGLKVKQWIEQLLAEPIGASIERWAERAQRRFMLRHTVPGQAGRVVVSAAELAFHPNSKAEGIVKTFLQGA